MFEDYCGRCGQCCTGSYCIPVEKEDIQMWENAGRHDIVKNLEHTSTDGVDETFMRTFGCYVTYCLHLKWEESGKAKCDIYKLRPRVCKEYPVHGNKRKGCSIPESEILRQARLRENTLVGEEEALPA